MTEGWTEIVGTRAGKWCQKVGGRQSAIARSLSDRMRVGNLPLDGPWRARATRIASRIGGYAPGYIDTSMVDCPSDAETQTACSGMLHSLGLDMPVLRPYASIVTCLGAAFHDDRIDWTNTLFCNWFIAGEARDFVLKGIGRVTVRPGDVFMFDPARAHALLQVGEKRFEPQSWSRSDCSAAPKDGLYSVFLGCELPITQEVAHRFNIERDNAEDLARRGWRCLDDYRSKVDASTGKRRMAQARAT